VLTTFCQPFLGDHRIWLWLPKKNLAAIILMSLANRIYFVERNVGTTTTNLQELKLLKIICLRMCQCLKELNMLVLFWTYTFLLVSNVTSLQQTCALSSAITLGKEGFALGKAFAECCTRQRAVGISLHGKGFFAKCRMSGTRQRISRVPRRHSAKIYTRQNKNTKKPKNNSKFFFLHFLR